MINRYRPTYSPEFRLEEARQAVDASRSIRDVSGSLGLCKSTDDKWARRLRGERRGNLTSATPLTPDQIKVRELERKLRISEEDNLTINNSAASDRVLRTEL